MAQIEQSFRLYVDGAETMTKVTCYYRGCEFNKSDTCTLKEIAVSENIHCMTATSKEEAAEIKAEEQP